MVARSAHDRWREAGGAVAQAEALRLRLCASVSRDAEVYGKARMLLRESGRDREHRGVGGATAARAREQRDFELAQALTSAAAEPVAIAEAAADVAALAAWSAENAGADERADALVAASLAEAAAGGAAQLVLVNLSVRTDDDLAARAKAAAAAAAESRSRAQATL
jgi:hypothetical protein